MSIECKPFFLPECQGCSLNKIVSLSDSIYDLFDKYGQILNKSDPVLIIGEPGTGKNVFAKALHFGECSERKKAPFMIKDFSRTESSELFKELFDNKTGAFYKGKKSLFEKADEGTLFLDEIGDSSLDMQTALLKAIKEKKLFRYYRTQKKPYKVRIVTSTNKDIAKMVKMGRFRKDLYSKLNLFSLSIPPLRKRKIDIIPLIHHFLKKLALRDGIENYFIAREVMQAFNSYNWPSNTRELENCLTQQISYLPAGENYIKKIPDELRYKIKHSDPLEHEPTDSAHEFMKQRYSLKPLWVVEKEAITSTLKACDGNRIQSTKILQIARNTLYRKIAEYNIKI